MGEDGSREEVPTAMWTSAVLIASQSFLFGYCFSCLNACLVTGDNNSGSDCYNGTDSSCPAGTIYNDINLSTSKLCKRCNRYLLLTVVVGLSS